MFPPIPDEVLGYINNANVGISNAASAANEQTGTGSAPSANVADVKSNSFNLTAAVRGIMSTFGSALNSAKVNPLLDSIEKIANGLNENLTKSQLDTRLALLNNRASALKDYVDDAAGNFELSKMFSEADTVGTNLGGFSTNVAENISDPDASPETPMFADVVGGINYDTLVEKARNAKDGLPGFAIGSINDCVHKASSVVREYGMASSPKSLLYLTAGQEMFQVQDGLNANMGKVVNYLRGTAPGQNDIA